MLLLPVVFAVAGYVFWRSPGPLRRVREEIPASQAAVAGVLVAMVLGFALNDSGIAVPAVMIGVLSASLVFLVVRLHEADAPRAGPTSVRASEDRPAPRSAPADDRQPVGAASGPSTVP
jgi:hypothetical protein